MDSPTLNVRSHRLRSVDIGHDRSLNLETFVNTKVQQFLLIALGLIIVGIAIVFALMVPWKGH